MFKLLCYYEDNLIILIAEKWKDFLNSLPIQTKITTPDIVLTYLYPPNSLSNSHKDTINAEYRYSYDAYWKKTSQSQLSFLSITHVSSFILVRN